MSDSSLTAFRYFAIIVRKSCRLNSLKLWNVIEDKRQDETKGHTRAPHSPHSRSLRGSGIEKANTSVVTGGRLRTAMCVLVTSDAECSETWKFPMRNWFSIRNESETTKHIRCARFDGSRRYLRILLRLVYFHWNDEYIYYFSGVKFLLRRAHVNHPITSVGKRRYLFFVEKLWAVGTCDCEWFDANGHTPVESTSTLHSIRID